MKQSPDDYMKVKRNRTKTLKQATTDELVAELLTKGSLVVLNIGTTVGNLSYHPALTPDQAVDQVLQYINALIKADADEKRRRQAYKNN